MWIYINDEPIQCVDDITIAVLLEQLEQIFPGTALSLNQQILPREKWALQQIYDGDCILLFQVIAGG